MLETPHLVNATYYRRKSQATDLLKLSREYYDIALERLNIQIKTKRRRLAYKAFRLRARARDSGFKNGLRMARIEQQQFLLNLEKLYESIITKANHDCLTVALSVAEEIIGRTIEDVPESLSIRIGRSLQSIIEYRKIVIKVNASDLDAVLNSISNEIPGRRFTVETDASVLRGNAIICTESGEIELSLEEHLKLLREQFTEQLNKSLNTQYA